MILIAKPQMKELLKNGATHYDDHRPVVKLFTPNGAATWLIDSAEPEDKNLDLQVERLVRSTCSMGNYFCRFTQIILAGSPPVPDHAAEPLRCGSWGRRIPG